jgi:outer membrane protein OmpA-like peptidoglycan-associated protein
MMVALPGHAGRDLVDSWNNGVVDLSNKCINTIGGTNGCQAFRELFNVDSATLSSKGMAILREVAGDLNKADEVTVVGHTDSMGDAAYNMELSRRRAESVKNFLKANNVDAEIDVVAMGESKPVASNATVAGRALNRRVEINY